MQTYKVHFKIHQYNDKRIREEIRNGADVNAPIEDGITYLMIAQSESLVRELLKLGANPHALDDTGMTALFYCMEPIIGEKEPGAIQALIQAGCDVNARDQYGNTALCHTYDPEVMKLLLDAGADPNSRDKDGMTPLMNANSLEEVQLLVDAGADVNAATTQGPEFFELGEYPCGVSPLMLIDSPAALKYLLTHGADINAVTPGGYSALMYHLYEHNISAVLTLIRAGAKLNVTAKDGNTPLHLICNCFRALLPEPQTFRAPVTEIVQALIQAGCDVNARNNAGETPLHTCGSGSAMRELIRAGANPNSIDNDGYAPIHTAAMHNHQCVSAILKTGADPNTRTKQGQNALFFINEAKSAIPLFRAGIDVNCTDKNGKTPLHDAAERNYLDLIRLLLINHADPMRKDNTGKTPLDYATNPTVIKRLKRAMRAVKKRLHRSSKS